MAIKKPIWRNQITKTLVLSLISGFFLFGGLVAVLAILPFPTRDLTAFPGTLLLFFLTVAFSFFIFKLLPPEDPSNESIGDS
ncbi:MAG: hypothetical protein ACXAEL_05795 [Candidatus Hodarchaeales archaeon]|jgi:hypothetical protein